MNNQSDISNSRETNLNIGEVTGRCKHSLVNILGKPQERDSSAFRVLLKTMPTQNIQDCAIRFCLGIFILTGFPVTRSLAVPLVPSQETTTPSKGEIFSLSQDRHNSESTTVFGTKGFKSWYIQGALATTLDNEEAFPRRFGLFGAGLSQFFRDGHSVNLELNSIYFNQPDDNAVGLNLALIGRWHLIRQSNWSFYIDGGAGVMGTTNNVPSGGASFNFTPQVGAGTTISLAHQKQLMLGLRWHHISHADLFDSNPGRDSIMAYVNLNLPR